MTILEPVLDGMPEPRPRWDRPAEAVRMSALELDLMLTAALPHAADDDELPALSALHLTVDDGLLQLVATDTVTALRERRPVNQTCEPFTFLLRRDDAVTLRAHLRALLRGLDKDERPAEPIDLFLDAHDGALALLGADLDVRFAQAPEADTYPDVARLIGRAFDRLEQVGVDAFDLHVNPTLLARVVAAQRAGRTGVGFRYRWTGDGAVLVTTTPLGDAPPDDLVILVQPIKLLQPAGAAA